MIIKKEFILLFFSLIINAKIIDFTIMQYDNELPTPSVNYPNEKYSTTLPLNTFINVNILWRTFQPKMIKERITNKLEIFIERTYKCEEYMTDMIINNLKIKNLSFYIPNGLIWVRESGLALGYHIKNESFSIVHNLFSNKKIEKLQFAFYNLFNKEKGTLFIGGIPSDKHKELPYKGIAKVNETLPTWGFALKSIKYNNSVYQMNIPCIIQSAIDDVFISNDIYQFMAEIVMKQEIESNRCEVKETQFLGESSLQKSIYCFEGSNVLNQSIEFTFENMKLELTIRDLYKFNKFPLVYSNGEPKLFHNFDGVILGANFLNLFHYTVFDYDNKQLEFYSDTTKITEILHSNKLRDCLIIFEILISISILQSVLLLIIKNNVSL